MIQLFRNAKFDDHSSLTRNDFIGGFGLALFLLFFQLNTTVAYVGLLVVTLVFAFHAKTWMPVMQRDTVAFFFLSIIIYLVYYSTWSIVEFPETAEDQQKALFNWIHWLFFIPIAWEIFRHRKHIDSILLILAVGVLIRIITQIDWLDIGKLFQGERTGFGMMPTVFSPIVGSIALGLLLLAPRMIVQKPTTAKWLVGLKFSVWLVCLVFFLESIVLSQTRGVWLGCALVFPLALIVRYKGSLANRVKISSHSLAMLALLCGLAGLFVHENYQTIFNRVNSEQIRSQPEAIKKQIGGQEILMTTSVGYRKLFWEIGIRKWRERAFFGWGPGTTEALLKQEKNPLMSQPIALLEDGSLLYLHTYHLHNLYLEFLVRFGLFGTLLFLALPLVLLVNVRKAQAKGSIPWDYACFLFAGWGLMAIMAFFDFQLYKYAWRNYCLIWAALTYAVHLEQLPLQHEKIQSKK